MPSAKRTVIAGWKQASEAQAALLGAGVAFYAFLSLFPAMIAAVTTYGLVSDPATVQRQSAGIAEALPTDAATLVTNQLKTLVTIEQRSLGLGLGLALALALYSASSGVGNLVIAINRMFGYEEDRGFLRRKLLSLVLTVCAILFMLVVLTLVAAAPAALDALVDVPGLRLALEVLRWALMVGAVVLAIGVLFRVAPNRPAGETHRLVGKGVLVAAGLWIVASLGFSLYVDNFGRYGATYGTLAGVVILLLWLWVGLYALLLGAAIEAVREDAPIGADAKDAINPG